MKLSQNPASSRAVFLDLNGTLVSPLLPESPQEYKLLPNALAALRILKESGLMCPVVTVQSRIEKGLYSKQDFLDSFKTFQKALRKEGAELLGPYVCPHRRSTPCECAKPNPTLFLAAGRELGIDLRRSFVVGDTADDVSAALAIGATPCLVETGWQPKNIGGLKEKIAFIGADLLAVAKWIRLRVAQS